MILDDPKKTTLKAIGVLACAVGVAAFAWPRHETQPPAPIGEQPPGELADFCADGLEPIQGGCLAVPTGAARPVPLVVYMHGMYGPKNIGEERVRQARVARMAKEKGFAVDRHRARRPRGTDARDGREASDLAAVGR
jgi:hypothetical protein